MRKHYSTYLRERIAGQERETAIVAAAARNAEQQSAKHLQCWLDEKQKRQLAEKSLAECRSELVFARAENHRLANLTAEHASLLDELKTLRQRIHRLEKDLNRRTIREGYFGLATPSSLKVSKTGATPENKAKKGGAVYGHEGHGRKGFTREEADEAIGLDNPPPPCSCGCGSPWQLGETREHCVIDLIPARREKRFYLKQEFVCSGCGRIDAAKTPGVVPGGLYGNRLVAHLMSEHYLHGLTVGNVCRREDINIGTFFKMADRCATGLKPVFQYILQRLLFCAIIHADETGWRNDGDKAWGWIFANLELVVFLFRDTRGSKVLQEVFGRDILELVLITDRYKAYDFLKVLRQYCYVHLLRDLKTLEKEFPDDREVAAFAVGMKPLLKQAIAMYQAEMKLDEYRASAAALKDAIVGTCAREANHPGIQNFQNIFREHPERLFQWVESPDIPCENNFAERGLRPTTIVRKISFGSQSGRGMKIREVLMTFLHTARVRGLDPEATLEEALDLLCLNPDADIGHLLGFHPKPTNAQEQAVSRSA